MGEITIHRPWGYLGLIRALNVLVNGEKVGAVKTKEAFEYELPAGDYELQVSMDWCKSKPLRIVINGGESTLLTVNTQFVLISIFACFLMPSKVFSLLLEPEN